MHKQGNVRHFVVTGHHVLGPPVVFTEQKAVVGGDDQGGVVPHGVLVHVVEQAPEFMVAQGHDGCIICADLITLLGPFGDAGVRWPVKDRAAIAGRIGLAELGRRMKRLVGIEGFQVQQPVAGGAVALQEFEPVAGLGLQRHQPGAGTTVPRQHDFLPRFHLYYCYM